VRFGVPPRRALRLCGVAALAAVAFCAAACGGSGGGPGVASIGSDSTTTAPSSTGGSSQSESTVLTRLLKYSECMRSHGLNDFPDPTTGPSGVSLNVRAGRGSDLRPNSPQFQAAQKACQSLMPGALITPAEKAAANAKAIQYADCMRAHGVPNFPDPNGQGLIKITPATNVDVGASQYNRAQRDCQKLSNGFDEILQGGPPPGSHSGNSGG
jgi:hypothetical protein